MKQLYQSPIVKLIGIETSDVVCTSGERLFEDPYDETVFDFN